VTPELFSFWIKGTWPAARAGISRDKSDTAALHRNGKRPGNFTLTDLASSFLKMVGAGFEVPISNKHLLFRYSVIQYQLVILWKYLFGDP
jgi:hypothetical protein